MQIRPEYQVVDEYVQIASSLSAKYPNIFPGMDLNQVRCVAITNKTRSDKKKLWEVKAVPMPIRMDCPYGWYIVIHMDDWADMTDKRKQYLVASSMCAIPSDLEEGKVFQPDLKDYAVMLRTFGVDYMDKEEDELKDLLQDEVKWIN